MLTALAVLQAVMVTPGFVPPTTGALRIVTERVETGQDPERRYQLERLVRFAREDAGYRAEVDVAESKASGPADLATLVRTGFSALSGRRIVIHFDAAGYPTQVEEQARIWERFVQATAQGAASRRSLPADQAAALATRVAAPLRELSEAEQRATIASLVTAAFARGPIEPVGSSRPVQLPGTSAYGDSVTLAGIRSTRQAGKLLEERTQASANLPSGTMAVERSSRFDPASGLVEHAEELRSTTTAGGAIKTSTTTDITLID